jgi:hypothetical protein
MEVMMKKMSQKTQDDEVKYVVRCHQQPLERLVGILEIVEGRSVEIVENQVQYCLESFLHLRTTCQ